MVQFQILVEITPLRQISNFTFEVIESEFIELVLFILVLVSKIGAIEVVQAVGQLVARESVHNEVAFHLSLLLFAEIEARCPFV